MQSLHIISHIIDLGCITLQMKLLLSRSLLVYEYQTTVKYTWSVEPISRKLTFHIWACSVCTIIFLKIPHTHFYMVSINYWNWIRIVRASKLLFRKSPFIVLVPIWRAGAGIFISTGHRPGMDKLLNSKCELNVFNNSTARTAHVNTYIGIQTICQKPLFHNQGGWKHVNQNPKIWFLSDNGTVMYTTYIRRGWDLYNHDPQMLKNVSYVAPNILIFRK